MESKRSLRSGGRGFFLCFFAGPVSISPDRERNNPATERQLPTPSVPDRKGVAEIYKEIYKEALQQYRFFGGLRGTATWPAATAVIAAMALLAKDVKLGDQWYDFFAPPVFYLIILLMACYINYSFQGRQAENYDISCAAMRFWRKSLTSDVPVLTYDQLRLHKHRPHRGKWFSRKFDGATKLFFWFSMVLVALAFVIAFIQWKPGVIQIFT